MALDCGTWRHGAAWLGVPSLALVMFIIMPHLHASLTRLLALHMRHVGHMALEVWVATAL